MTVSPTLDFLEGLAGTLVTASIGVYQPDGPVYTAAQTAIYLNDMPDGPDRAIVLTAYNPGGDDILLAMGEQSVQVRTRASNDPRDEMRLRDQIYAAFQGLRGQTYGSVHVVVLSRVSTIPLGRDPNGRWEASTNWIAAIDLPATQYRN